MSELDLLCECISTEGETEGGGVKFIWMDEGTIYRFENNRMKKIGKQLINKAKREITRRQKIPQSQQVQQQDDDDENERKPTKAKRTKKPSKPIVIDDSEDEEDEQEEPEIIPPPKVAKATKRGKQLKRSAGQENLLAPSIDLDEYYSNKHKMEYMTNEINRLNGKIGKLKQYKSIVNKLTGGEIDDLPTNGSIQQDAGRPAWQQIQQQTDKNNVRPSVNDSLFMYGL